MPRSMRRWTEKEEQYLFANQGKIKIEQAAENLNRTKSSVSRKIHQLNIEWGRVGRPSDGWTKQQDQFLLDNWQNMSCDNLSKILDRTVKAVEYRRSKLGLGKKFLVNASFFSEPSQDMMYVLGYIYADGSLYQGINASGNPIYSFSVHSKDEAELQAMLSLIAPGRKASKTRRGLSSFKLTNEQMYRDLTKYGLHPNKSKTIAFPSIDDRYLGSFVRGHFDGDGSICFVKSNGRWKLCFTSGSSQFLQQMRDRLHKAIGTSNKVTVQGFNMIFSKKSDVESLGRLMYPNEDVMCLNRKRNKVLKAIEWASK